MQHHVPTVNPRSSLLRSLPFVGALVFGGALGLGVTVSTDASASAMLTFCQQNGHGASGCLLADGVSKGWCVKNNTVGTTGYVCSEKDPNKKDEAVTLEPEVKDKGTEGPVEQ